MGHRYTPRNNIGIFNSRSHMQEYVHELKRESNSSPTAPTFHQEPTREDLEFIAAEIAGRYHIACRQRREIRVKELERQLVLLAEYAGVI
jgi:hypothetical protein